MLITPKITNLGYSNLWSDMSTILGYNANFEKLIAKLFANGEQGFFYDPNDLSTLYQDADGTIPVTAATQPAGLMLDISKRGSWSEKKQLGTPVVVGVADQSYYDTNTGVGSIYRADQYNQSIVNLPVNNSRWYRLVIENTGSKPINVNAELAMGTVLFSVPSGQKVTRIIKQVTTITITSANDVSAALFKVHSLTELLGNHAYQTNSTSRPILRRNAVTGANYLEFDGSDDFLRTDSIDFTGTDEMSLFAGIKNTSTNPYQNIVELSASVMSNNGTFLLRCPQESLRPFYLSRGTVSALTENLSTTPYVLAGVVLSSQSKISTDRLYLRVDGVLNSISTDQGTGNYGNYPLYIGRRGGASQPFSGHIYSLIGVGKLVSDSETAAIEKELAKRVGVTLSV